MDEDRQRMAKTAWHGSSRPGIFADMRTKNDSGLFPVMSEVKRGSKNPIASVRSSAATG